LVVLALVVAPDQLIEVEVHSSPPSQNMEDGEQAVGEQPPFSLSISTPSLSIGGGATTLTFCKRNTTEVKNLLATLPLLALGVVSLTTCESNNEKVRKKVKALVVSVTPKTIFAAINELDEKAPEQEGTLIPLEILPASLSAFAPIEVQYRDKGSYLIVTDRWVQHRTGLLVAAPNEIVPESSVYLTYEKLGDRLYFYQD
jgi:hypothetical protein